MNYASLHRRLTLAPYRTLAVLLTASEAIYLLILRFDATNGVRPVLTFLALLASLFVLYSLAGLLVQKVRDQRGILFLIITGAVLFRLTLLPAGLASDNWTALPEALRADVRGEAVAYERFLLYDHDIWRYLWDGHVQAHGINPFQSAPADAALDALADVENRELTDGRAVWRDIRDNINHATTPTIYPPLAQLIFRLAHWLAPGSVLVMKSLLTSFDLLTVWLLALTLNRLGRPMTEVLWYAWNPLVIKVFAGSGHVDAVLVAALTATIYFLTAKARTTAALSFGLAVLAKLSPVVLLPFVVRRVGWRHTMIVAAVVVIGYVPYLSAGPKLLTGLIRFSRDWQFNAGPFALLQWLASSFSHDPATVARMLSGLLIIGVVMMLTMRDDGQTETTARHCALALGALVIFSPAVMPWYVSWVLPLAVIAGQRWWFWFSALVCLAFLVLIDETEHAWVLWLEYGLGAAIGVAEFRRRSLNRNPTDLPADALTS